MGIAQALLTPALGLVVALITLFPYMIFRAHVERAIGRLESVIAAAQQGAEIHPAGDVRQAAERRRGGPEPRQPAASVKSGVRPDYS